jgi:hypothetical protein
MVSLATSCLLFELLEGTVSSSATPTGGARLTRGGEVAHGDEARRRRQYRQAAGAAAALSALHFGRAAHRIDDVAGTHPDRLIAGKSKILGNS